MKATLILANGTIFSGASMGVTTDRICEMVFNTSMAGYQEILTDPSCAGQGIVMSYPLIGNYGVNSADNESDRPWAEALVVRHLSPRGSNFRCERPLDDYLKEFDITGIQGIDTRALTKILRSQGSMNGMLTCAEHFNIPQVLEKLRTHHVQGAVERVTCKERTVYSPDGTPVARVAVMDYGVKNSIVESLRLRGCQVTILPASTPAQEVLGGGFDGVLLSNGPGDPADYVELAAQIKVLYGSSIPIFGVGLGHQLLALATGAKTGRLHYGHRGSNHPVQDLLEKRVFITHQNHGYMVLADTVRDEVAAVSHVSANDNTVEGLCYQRPNCFSVQFYPEASPGPQETRYLLDRFVAAMGGDR